MPLKAQDVLVALRLALTEGFSNSYAALAEELGMSASEAHAAMRRLEDARLLDPAERHIRRSVLRNFLIHGVPYAFAVRVEGMTRGIPTAWAAPVFAGEFVSGDQLPPVWPDPEGQVQGLAVKPLYPSAPHAAKKNDKLYSLLAAVDALRIGRARERAAAERKIAEFIPDRV